jgi:hypothetical protein
MSSRSERIDGDRSDEEIIRELAEGDDVVAEIFSKLQESMDSSNEVRRS